MDSGVWPVWGVGVGVDTTILRWPTSTVVSDEGLRDWEATVRRPPLCAPSSSSSHPLNTHHRLTPLTVTLSTQSSATIISCTMSLCRCFPSRLAAVRRRNALTALSVIRRRWMSTSPYPPPPASAAPRVRDPIIDSLLRVDHAGEYGAQCIYNGQLAALALRSALKLSPPSTSASSSSSASSSGSSPSPSSDPVRVIEEMRDQEVGHLRALERLLPIHHSRPTLLLPLWHVAGYALGYGTALLGVKAAMACTVAVEEVITEHYNDQLRTLNSPEFLQSPIPTSATAEEVKELRAIIKKHRDEEEEHRDIGISHEAEDAPLYSLLTNVIKAGCHVAINVAKVI